MNFKLLMNIALILTLFACNASKKVELTKNEMDKESTAITWKSFEGKIFYDFIMKDKTLVKCQMKWLKTGLYHQKRNVQTGNGWANEYDYHLPRK